MNNPGYKLKKYLLEVLDTEEKKYKELTKLDYEETSRYEELLAHLELVNSSKNYTTIEKGKALENLVSFLLEKSSVFDIQKNIRNSTNEIDQLLTLNFKGLKFREFLPFPEDLILCECKNYNRKISVTWVGKFFSLLASNRSKIGLLFSYHGLSGENWNSSVGLTKKIFLLKEKLEERIYIIDINIKDFRLIAEGCSLLQLIKLKMSSLRTDTDIKDFINLKHPALEKE
ncbi:acetylglutamate semialdehyde dehydrogenase [Paenibacillus larvae]